MKLYLALKIILEFFEQFQLWPFEGKHFVELYFFCLLLKVNVPTVPEANVRSCFSTLIYKRL